jgi:hypothetical protein
MLKLLSRIIDLIFPRDSLLECVRTKITERRRRGHRVLEMAPDDFDELLADLDDHGWEPTWITDGIILDGMFVRPNASIPEGHWRSA